MTYINCYGKCDCGNGIYEVGMYSCNDCINKNLGKLASEDLIKLADRKLHHIRSIVKQIDEGLIDNIMAMDKIAFLMVG